MSTGGAVIELERGRRFRSVELAKRTEVDTWALADAVYEDVNERLPMTNVDVRHGVKTGLGVAEDEVERAHREAGTDVGRHYLHNLYVTVRAWPEEDRRPKLATFHAHYELRGAEYRNRVGVLEQLAAKSARGRVGQRDLIRWKSERKPPQHRTFLELVERRLRAALKAAGKPWHTVVEDDRQRIASILRAIASEVEGGTFPDAS